MKLEMVRHLWGVTEAWESAIPRFAGLGYRGIESPMPAGDGEADRLCGIVAGAGMEYVAMAFTAADSVAGHVRSLAEQVGRARSLGAGLVVVHGGEDRWETRQAIEFYREAVKVEKDSGVKLAHETHRGRCFFSPWSTATVLREVPEVNLCCDYSHWVVVSERLLMGEEGILELAAGRCVHLHARVGYAQGPQVPDPAGAEYVVEVAAHRRWWEAVWGSQRRRGMARATVTPEFGPPGYLHTLPATAAPVADLERVCEWMTGRVREWFGEG